MIMWKTPLEAGRSRKGEIEESVSSCFGGERSHVKKDMNIQIWSCDKFLDKFDVAGIA
jgi:hypothetical protein